MKSVFCNVSATVHMQAEIHNH